MTDSHQILTTLNHVLNVLQSFLLAPRRKVILEKLTSLQLVKNSPYFMEVQWHLIVHAIEPFLSSWPIFISKQNTAKPSVAKMTKVTDQECGCKQLDSAILLYFLNSSLQRIQSQFIYYCVQWLSDCVRNLSHISLLIFYAYLHSLWESSLWLRVKKEMLLK